MAGQGLQDGGDDGGSAGRTERQHRPAVVQHDRRGHGRARPLAGAGQVRVRDSGRRGGEGEVGQLVVEQEAAAGDCDRAAAGGLDGQGVGDDVAPAVGDRQVRGVLALVRGRGGLSGGGAGHRAARVAGGQRAGQGPVRLDQAGAGVGEALREQLAGRHVLGGRITDPAAAVGEGDPGGLDEAVQVLRLGELGEVGAFEDVERLADRGAAGGGGRHAVDVQAPVADPGGVLPLGAVRAQVPGGQVAGPDRAGGRGVHRGCADGADDVVGDGAPVEGAGSLAGEFGIGVGEVRVLEGGADDRQGAARQEELRGVREVPEPGFVELGLCPEGGVHREAVAGQFLGGPQELAQRAAAPGVEGALPGGGGAGDTDAEAAGLALGEGDRLAVLLEQGGRGRGRGGLPAVDGVHPAGAGVVVDEVAAASDPGRVGLGDAERGGGGDGRVDGVAAGAQHGDPGCRGVGVDAGDGSAVAGGDGYLRRRGGGRGGGGRGGSGPDECGDDGQHR